MKRIALPPLALLVFLAACTASGQSPGPSSPGSPGGSDPGAADELILSVESAGGFMMLDFVARQMPAFTLLGDGLVVVQGAQIDIFPSPALPPLQARRLNAAGIQAVLDLIEETGLFTQDLELRGAQAIVADASDTVFTFRGGDADVTISVYALGMLDPTQPVPAGITAAEIQAHRVLAQLNDRLTLLETWLPADSWADTGWQPYEPAALRLYARDVTAEAPEPGIDPGEQPWPIEGEDPAAFGEEQALFGNGTRCGVVEGEDAATWFAALSEASQITRFTSGDVAFGIVPRPLLPHEDLTCPELGGGA